MLGIKLVRENPKVIEKDLKKRNDAEKMHLLKEAIVLDKEHRKNIQEVQKLKSERNKISEEIATLKNAGKDVKKKMAEASKIPKRIKEIDAEVKKMDERLKFILMRLPNILHESVPVGKDDSENVETKKGGKAPKFKFDAKGHVEILEELGLIDMDRGAKIAGHGFYYLKGDLVKLDYALMRFTIDFLEKRGYTIIEPPYMMNRESYDGVVEVESFDEVMYKIENENMYLIATSEHPMAAMFMNEVLNKNNLPIKMCGVSTNFRKEVGTHGKYTKGLFRMHQFNKVEQFIFCLPEESWKYHEELQKNAEDLYNALELHYRVVNVCTGDIGQIAAKKYDIEVWMADGKFREAGSNSNCTDYQARRLNVKYRDKEGQKPAGYVHTLNNTAIATSRTMIAIIEQHQKKDGTVDIPKILHKYTGFKVLKSISKKL